MSHFSGQSWSHVSAATTAMPSGFSFAPRTAEPTQEEKESLLASLPSHKDISLKCPMCSGTLTDPRTLPCLHSFYLACLEAQVETDLASIPAPAPAPTSIPAPAPASGSLVLVLLLLIHLMLVLLLLIHLMLVLLLHLIDLLLPLPLRLPLSLFD